MSDEVNTDSRVFAVSGSGVVTVFDRSISNSVTLEDRLLTTSESATAARSGTQHSERPNVA
jgi:hypothetical protein